MAGSAGSGVRGGKWVVTANGYEEPSRSEENGLKLIVAMVVQLNENKKNH